MDKLNLKPVERVHSIDSKTFKDNYFNPHIPVVISDFSKDWPALNKWTPEYFQSKYGKNEVKVFNGDFGKPGKSYMGVSQTMAFGDYLQKIFFSSSDLRMFLYNIMKHAKELTQDVIKPTLVKGFSENFYFMFFGPKGAVTQIHYDIDMSHVFHTTFQGRKRFVLFAQDQSKFLYRHPLTVRSYVDVDNPDFTKFPKLKEAQGYEVILEPGETLFIPAGHWHHIVYEDAGFALSLRCRHQNLFKRIQGFYNILVMQMLDRLINKIDSGKWFEWKESRAREIAEA